MKNDNEEPKMPKFPEIEKRFEVMGIEVDQEQWEKDKQRDWRMFRVGLAIIAVLTIIAIYWEYR